jgi:hypothetical protein
MWGGCSRRRRRGRGLLLSKVDVVERMGCAKVEGLRVERVFIQLECVHGDFV